MEHYARCVAVRPRFFSRKRVYRVAAVLKLSDDEKAAVVRHGFDAHPLFIKPVDADQPENMDGLVTVADYLKGFLRCLDYPDDEQAQAAIGDFTSNIATLTLYLRAAQEKSNAR